MRSRPSTRVTGRGRGRIVGRKIGLTAEAVQKQLGVGQPDYGVLFEDMQIADGKVVSYRAKVKVSFKYHPEAHEKP